MLLLTTQEAPYYSKLVPIAKHLCLATRFVIAPQSLFKRSKVSLRLHRAILRPCKDFLNSVWKESSFFGAAYVQVFFPQFHGFWSERGVRIVPWAFSRCSFYKGCYDCDFFNRKLLYHRISAMAPVARFHACWRLSLNSAAMRTQVFTSFSKVPTFLSCDQAQTSAGQGRLSKLECEDAQLRPRLSLCVDNVNMFTPPAISWLTLCDMSRWLRRSHSRTRQLTLNCTEGQFLDDLLQSRTGKHFIIDHYQT